MEASASITCPKDVVIVWWRRGWRERCNRGGVWGLWNLWDWVGEEVEVEVEGCGIVREQVVH